MKTFYTQRDIEDMHEAGVTEIVVDDDVVLTDLAREKAIALGIEIKRAEEGGGRPQPPGAPRLAATPPAPRPAPTAPPAGSPPVDPELMSRIKSAVIARLGTSEHSDLLDKIIPQVLARLSRRSSSDSGSSY